MAHEVDDAQGMGGNLTTMLRHCWRANALQGDAALFLFHHARQAQPFSFDSQWRQVRVERVGGNGRDVQGGIAEIGGRLALF